MRIKKANAILKGSVNKLFRIEHTYPDTNQTCKGTKVKIKSSRNC